MTSSIQHNHCPTLATDEQLNQHEQRTNDDEGDYIKINSPTTVLHSTMTNDDRDMNNVDDDDDDAGNDTDRSHSSDELRSVGFGLPSDFVRIELAFPPAHHTKIT
jgi:hypothetical protein